MSSRLSITFRVRLSVALWFGRTTSTKRRKRISAQDLSFAELISAKLTLTGVGPIGEWWRANEVGRMFAPEIDPLRPVLAAAPAESSELDRLVSELADEDAVHDQEVRFGDGLLALIGEQYWDASVRADAQQLRALLFPDGARLTNKSYAEGGPGRRASGRAHARGAQQARAHPHRHACGRARQPRRVMAQNLQPSSERLARLLTARTAAGSDGTPSPAELLDAKRRFIALVTQMFAIYRTLDPRLGESDRIKLQTIKSTWTDAVRAATDRAARRRAARAAVVAPPPARAPT